MMRKGFLCIPMEKRCTSAQRAMRPWGDMIFLNQYMRMVYGQYLKILGIRSIHPMTMFSFRSQETENMDIIHRLILMGMGIVICL